MPFNRLDVKILAAIAAEAHAQSLPLAVHTGNAQDVADAVSAGANSIEHGSFRDAIPDDLFVKMRGQKIFYVPTLAVAEALLDLENGSTEPLESPLVQQVVPAALIASSRKFVESSDGKKMAARLKQYAFSLDLGRRNLLRAYQNGVLLATGTDSGNPLVFHGPARPPRIAALGGGGHPSRRRVTGRNAEPRPPAGPWRPIWIDQHWL